jgi:hypothetical protein
MKTLKALGDVSCVFLACVGVVIICFFAYYSLFNKDITTGANYIDDQLGIDVKKADELTETERNVFEERYFMVASYYDNSKENGVQLQELRFDYFTDYTLTSDKYRSTGMQYLGDFSTYTTEVKHQSEADRKVVDDFYYYDTTNGVTWSGYNSNGGSIGTTLNRNQVFTVKIDNRPFAIQLTGGYDIYGDKRFLGFLWKTGVKVVGSVYYDYGDVFDCVFKAIKSNNRGYGDYYVTVDLSDFFTVKEYDPASGQYKADDVTDIIKNYAVLKFHYEANGAIASGQSLFGSIECNSKYDLNTDDYDTAYWQERFVYNLTARDLTLRYSEVSGGSFASLSLAMRETFKNMGRVKVNITLDLVDTNIVGFDFNAFENFEIDTVTLVGTNQAFHFSEKCLFNSQLKTIRRSSGLTLTFGENAIDNAFAEAVL